MRLRASSYVVPLKRRGTYADVTLLQPLLVHIVLVLFCCFYRRFIAVRRQRARANFGTRACLVLGHTGRYTCVHGVSRSFRQGNDFITSFYDGSSEVYYGAVDRKEVGVRGKIWGLRGGKDVDGVFGSLFFLVPS